MQAEFVNFPADRSSHDVRRWRSESLDCGEVSPGDLDLSKAVAFAAILAFSRMTGLASLQVTVETPGPERRYFAGTIQPDETLGQAFRNMRATAEPEDGSILDLIVIQGMDGTASAPSDHRARLFFTVENGRLALLLSFDSGAIAQVSARDFLEKICLVVHALADRPDQRCDGLELIGKTASELIADLSKPIPLLRYESVAATFFEIVQRHGKSPAIAGDGHRYSYAELSGAVRVLGGKLRVAGLTPGDVVAVRGTSSFGMIAGVLAVIVSGGVLVTIDQTLPETRQALIERISGPKFVIQVGSPADRATDPREIAMPDWPSREVLEKLLSDAPPVDNVVFKPADESSAYIFFTSGSTGEPKGGLGTHRGLSHFFGLAEGSLYAWSGRHGRAADGDVFRRGSARHPFPAHQPCLSSGSTARSSA